MRSGWAALGLILPALAAPVRAAAAYSLDEAIQEARSRNPEILAARRAWEAQEARITAERTWSDPMIGPDLWRIPTGKAPTPGNARMDMYMIRQDIPFPGKLSTQGTAQRHAALAARRRLEAVELAAVESVAEAYHELWRLDEAVRIQNAHAALWKGFVTVAEKLYAAGKTMMRDVLRAQVEADKAAVQAANLEERRPFLLARLNALRDRPPESPVDSLEAPSVAPDAGDFEALASSAARHNPELAALRELELKGKALRRRARLDYLPDLTASWSRMQEADGFSGYNARLMLHVPLYFWKQRAESRASSARADESAARLRDAGNQVDADVRAAAADARNAARVVEVYRASVLPRARKTLEIVQSGYLANQAGFLDLLDSEHRLLAEELEYVDALAEHGKAVARLERVVGVPLR